MTLYAGVDLLIVAMAGDLVVARQIHPIYAYALAIFVICQTFVMHTVFHHSASLVARNRPSNPGLELFEKSKIDGLGHGAVAKIVRMVLISRGKTRQHSLGVIRLAGEQLDPVGVRPPEPGYNSNTSMAVSA